MEAKTTRLYDIAMTAGPDISVTKTRSMRINTSQEAPLTVNGQVSEEVDEQDRRNRRGY